MGSEDVGVAARAAYRLGLLLRDAGDLEGAQVALRAATGSGDGEVVPRAAYQLGKILHRGGRLAEAAAEFQRTIDSRHRICADLAVEALAHVRLSEHRVEEAKELFLAASASQQAELAAHAMLSLAELWLWSGSDLDRAEAGLRRVIDSGFPNLLTPAWALLGELLAGLGRGAEAEPLLRAAARDGDPTAMLDLAILILADSQPEAAQMVEHLGHRPQALSDRFVSSSAGLPAAMATRTESQFMAALETPMAPPAVLEEAELLLRATLAAGKQEAAVALAVVLESTDRAHEAEQLLRHAVDAEVRNARTNLAQLLIKQAYRRSGTCSSDEAETLLQHAGQAGDLNALNQLAAYYVMKGDDAHATVAFHNAANAGSPFARVTLILFLAAQGSLGEACSQLAAMLERDDERELEVFTTSLANEGHGLSAALNRARETRTRPDAMHLIELLARGCPDNCPEHDTTHG
jgi:tetratricopeptide (TPR) repeat protein